jgi:hypothetical protein
MPFLHGTHPTMDELSSDDSESALAVSVSKALLWLAANNLLYTDLRPPNVMVLSSGGIRLVDYDDMRVVPKLWERVESEGVAAFSPAFALEKRETDFTTKYPGICKALAAGLRVTEERAKKRACVVPAAGDPIGAPGPTGPVSMP